MLTLWRCFSHAISSPTQRALGRLRSFGNKRYHDTFHICALTYWTNDSQIFYKEFYFYKRSQNLQFLKGLTFCLVCLTALPFSCSVVETCKHPLGWQAAGMQSGRWVHRRWKITFPGWHHWKDVAKAELLESSNLKKITNLLFFILAVPSALNWLTGHHWVSTASRGRWTRV